VLTTTARIARWLRGASQQSRIVVQIRVASADGGMEQRIHFRTTQRTSDRGERRWSCRSRSPRGLPSSHSLESTASRQPVPDTNVNDAALALHRQVPRFQQMGLQRAGRAANACRGLRKVAPRPAAPATPQRAGDTGSHTSGTAGLGGSAAGSKKRAAGNRYGEGENQWAGPGLRVAVRVAWCARHGQQVWADASA